MRQKKAFSLIEILVVISIISILATIGLSSYSGVQKKARDSRRMADLETIRAAIEQYRSNNSVYPTTITYGSPLCDPAPGSCVTGTYIASIPSDPDPTLHYVYQYLSAGSDYNVCALVVNQTTLISADCGKGAGSCTYCLGPYGKR